MYLFLHFQIVVFCLALKGRFIATYWNVFPQLALDRKSYFVHLHIIKLVINVFMTFLSLDGKYLKVIFIF